MAGILRPSPSDSATMYSPGTEKSGNDGRIWKVASNTNGVRRWVPAGRVVITPPAPKVMTWKYFPGDELVVATNGFGFTTRELGKKFIVEEQIEFAGHPGYKMTDGTKAAEQSFDPSKIISKQPQYTKTNMAKLKAITKKTAQEVRAIETSLINKEEVFKMLALAEATGLPLLLVGDPGVAKTKSIIDYAKAWLNRDGKMTPEDFMNKIFILETDEGTKASEIKGMPDFSKLFTENQYELNAPVAEAEIVIINEVDKASSAIRNAMLGVMNEKFLFNGKHKIPCKWKLFVATCNEIPKEEANSPFWDRFMLKMNVSRVSASEISRYYQKGARDYRENFKIGIPNAAELASLEIPVKKLDKYLEVGYVHSSDRTLTFVPKLAKAVSFVWDISIDKALVKTAQIMISQAAGSELQNKLMSPEVKAVMSKVEMLNSYGQNEQLELAVAEIESLINAYALRGVMDESQVLEIETSMTYILQNHPARQNMGEGNLEDLMDETKKKKKTVPAVPTNDELPF